MIDVILMDVLGYSLEEIAAIVQSTVPAVKASLHRGPVRLRELAEEPEDAPAPTLAPPERALLLAYIDRFNARDFDATRPMLAEEVSRSRRQDDHEGQGRGTDVLPQLLGRVRLAAGARLRGAPSAILVCDPARPSDAPLYPCCSGGGRVPSRTCATSGTRATRPRALSRSSVICSSRSARRPRRGRPRAHARLSPGIGFEEKSELSCVLEPIGRGWSSSVQFPPGLESGSRSRKFGVRILVSTDRRRGPSLRESQN
jgi:hypothetical protein